MRALWEWVNATRGACGYHTQLRALLSWSISVPQGHAKGRRLQSPCFPASKPQNLCKEKLALLKIFSLPGNDWTFSLVLLLTSWSCKCLLCAKCCIGHFTLCDLLWCPVGQMLSSPFSLSRRWHLGRWRVWTELRFCRNWSQGPKLRH